MEQKWLKWAKKLQSIAQAGLTYSKDKYDIERFEQIRDLSIQILTEYTDVGREKIKDLFCNEKGYQTPKIDVRGVVFKNNKILLVKEKIDGRWSLPGGWAEIDLSVKENVIKEVKEEAGLNVTPKTVIAILDASKNNGSTCIYSIYKTFVLCELVDGHFEENIETETCEYFSLDNLPPLSTNRVNEEQIKMCFNAHLNNNVPIMFD